MVTSFTSSMNFVQRIAQQLYKVNTPHSQVVDQKHIQRKLEDARSLKHDGNYEAALQILDEAETLLTPDIVDNMATWIALRRIEVLLCLNDWPQIETVLLNLKQQSKHLKSEESAAFILLTEGNIAQHQDSWEEAREYYEQAMKIARENTIENLAGRAAGYLADVYTHEDNLSYAIYLLEDALDRLDKSGDLELSGYFLGRLGEAYIAIGEQIKGQQLLGRALRLAEHLQDKIYALRWRSCLAVQAIIDDHYEDAKRHLLIVLSESNQKTYLEGRIFALCRMSKTCLRLNETSIALDYAGQAYDLTKNSNQDTLHTLATANLGITLRSIGKNEEALSHLNNAIISYPKIKLTQADYSTIDILRNLAAAQSDTGDHKTAKQTYENALTIAKNEETPLAIAEIYSDLGILYTRQNNHADAINVWRDAIGIYTKQGHHARTARLYCDIANLRKQIGNNQRALKDYEKALMLLNSFDDPATRGVVLSNAATAYVDQGDIETAEAFFVEAIKIAIKLQDRLAEATRRGNYGWFLVSTGRAQQATTTLTYALKQSETLGLKLQSAVQLDNLGLAQDELGDRELAIKHHRQALKKINELPNTYWIALIKANLAHSLISNDNFDEASTLLTAALQMSQEISNSEIIVHAMNGQSRIALQQNKPLLQDHFDEAIHKASQASLRRLLADAYTQRSQFFADQGNYDLSLNDWQSAVHWYKILNLKRSAPWLESTTQSE